MNKLDQLKKIIVKNPELYPFYNKEAFIHKVVLTKHNIVFYQVDKLNKTVHIVTIFNVYQDPEKLKI